MDFYKMTIAGLERELLLCPLNDKLDIAAFIMFSDTELTVAASEELLKKCPDFYVILTAESKGIPLAYDKDIQEDKEPVFDAIDTVKMCLKVAAPMIRTMNVHRDRMLKAARQGFINATDLADYLTKKGMPFRTAYQLTGQIVADCIDKDTVLEDLSIEEYRAYDALFEEDLYEAIDLGTCVATRTSKGGTSPESVKEQIDIVRKALA